MEWVLVRYHRLGTLCNLLGTSLGYLFSPNQAYLSTLRYLTPMSPFPTYACNPQASLAVSLTFAYLFRLFERE